MKIVKQLSIFLENRPGVFAKVCATFAQNGINILAIMVTDASDHAVVRLVVDKNERAKELLEDRGVLALETDIVAVTLKNAPGAFVKLTTKLATKDINFDYAYASATPSQDNAVVYFRVGNIQQAMRKIRQ